MVCVVKLEFEKMKSIIHHHHHHHQPPQPPPLSTLSKLNHTQHLNPHRLHYFSRHPPLRIKAMAITSSHLVVLGVNPPPATTGDLSVLIPTSIPVSLLDHQLRGATNHHEGSRI
ncbi:uncharacterized protein LOC112514350 isoform X2 [Cynara cardunculus var. scolymus]|uniref:uncharacterized protein LOC112514350 isoform X2 n=1 Tax=Cynara cardunculus var. scolymus TaxID=59895 RepID=UPI000D625DF3|nr:uncharacterized protein LOC112514350 isoform X2 [Cynara cardunculus var. scolymus]